MRIFIVLVLLLIVFTSIGHFINIRRQQNEQSIKEKESQYTSQDAIARPIDDMWGEPAKAMFPDITEPKYVDVKHAEEFLNDSDDVYFFPSDNAMYIYPASIFGFHHIVNDVIDGRAVAATLCLLSDSALMYSREIDQTISLGVLGPLYYGNLVMYDKDTDSYVLQLTGEVWHGKRTGKKLRFLSPLYKTSWKKLKGQRNAKVLSPPQDIAFYRNFYKKYQSSPIGLNSLKNRKSDERLLPFTAGLGIIIHDQARFYPLDVIKEKKIINDTVNGWNLLIMYDNVLETPKIFRRFLDGKILNFEIRDGILVDRETLSRWDSQGLALSGILQYKTLPIPQYSQVYWFSWASFYPHTDIYR